MNGTDISAVSAVDVVDVVAVLALELGVGVVEGQSVTAQRQRRFAVLALPVLVARRRVREETVLLRAVEFCRHGCKPQKYIREKLCKFMQISKGMSSSNGLICCCEQLITIKSSGFVSTKRNGSDCSESQPTPW
jgi:hypothetical protein